MTTRAAAGVSGRRRLAQAVRGVLAAIVLLALVVGIPVALLHVSTLPIPHSVPAPADVLHTLTERDDGQLFFAALTIVAWLGWATFALAVLLELPAQLRGLPSTRLRGMAVQQSLAGAL